VAAAPGGADDPVDGACGRGLVDLNDFARSVDDPSVVISSLLKLAALVLILFGLSDCMSGKPSRTRPVPAVAFCLAFLGTVL